MALGSRSEVFKEEEEVEGGVSGQKMKQKRPRARIGGWRKSNRESQV